MKIILPKPHAGQKELLALIDNPAIQYLTVSAGRRFGKTFVCICWLFKQLCNHKKSNGLFCSRWNEQVREAFEFFLMLFEDCPIIESVNRTNKTIYFKNKSKLTFISAHNHDSIRSKTLDYIVLDEFAIYEEEAFTKSIQPTMGTNPRAKCIFISTPRGKGLFYRNYLLGLDKENNPRWASYTAPSSSNPLVDKDFLEDVKNTVSDKVYKQEYEAQFIDDMGSLFENIKACTNKENKFKSNKAKCAGIDLGFTEDFCVITILNEFSEIIYWDRFNQCSYETAVKRLHEPLRKFGYPKTNIEVNMYENIYQDLKKDGCRNIFPFTTTTANKKPLVDKLLNKFQQAKILIPNDPIFIREFEDFTYTFNPKTRYVTYSAPSGLHDDCVMSASLANDLFEVADISFGKL